MGERVTWTIDGGVADVKLARPDKLNALDAAMFEALVDAGERLATEPSLRATVLSGQGRAFCAGLDFASFAAGGTGLLSRQSEHPGNTAQRAALVWRELPVPVIAAVHGYAFGGGLQIALGADMRIVAPDAQLSIMEIRWGLVPDMSGPQTLRRLARLDVIKELTFTGRKLDGREAVALGLATRVSETPYEDALALAREIATKSPDAIRAAKRLLDASGLLPLEEGLLMEEAEQRALFGSPNQREAVEANLQKRAPRFRDPE